MAYLAHRRADLVTANSVGALETLRSLPELAARRVELSPNIGEGATVERPGSAPHFLVIGRLVPHKRVAWAVDIFAEVADQTPGWNLLIAGQGPEEDPLRARAAELGLEDRVQFLGFVDDIPGLLREGGVLLHLAAYEGTPNVIMEAMAAGVPVIVTGASPGPVELVKGSGPPSGVVCEDGDREGVRSAMVELASDAVLREEFGQAGIRRAEGWSWPAVRNDWLKILGLEQ